MRTFLHFLIDQLPEKKMSDSRWKRSPGVRCREFGSGYEQNGLKCVTGRRTRYRDFPCGRRYKIAFPAGNGSALRAISPSVIASNIYI